MKHTKTLLVCWLSLLISSKTINAQFYAQSAGDSYINHSLTLRSDFPSKSVLISNLIADKAGDMSPVIGAASWPDNGRQLQCRSILEFNYQFLPAAIISDPSQITSAELVLYPLHVDFSDNDLDKPSKLIIRRVLENWEDSTTMWTNQPFADSSLDVVKVIKKKQKGRPVFADVTDLVIKMLRYGNNGFMIYNENPSDSSMALGQLFASPKNDNEDIRPILVINFKTWDPNFSQTQFFRDQREVGRIQMPVQTYYQQPVGNAPVQQPVNQPETAPVKD